MEESSMLDVLSEHLNLILMIVFIFFYSVLVFFNSSKTKVANFCRNVVFMASGMLFVYYIFQISYLEDYKEFEYIIAFLIALSFRDLLPVLINFVVDVCTVKLNQLDAKLKKE
tara:strand:+ start:395 stop:733 length:339 start_codon:yes stop_codon:yes gene_type:complete